MTHEKEQNASYKQKKRSCNRFSTTFLQQTAANQQII
jgi:hypothetical protein